MFNSGRFLLLALAACFFYPVIGQDRDQVTAKFTEWYHNKAGAVSFSFDDAGFTQYTAAYPLLEKYSVKATFSIVGEWVKEEPGISAEPGHFEYMKMGWQQLLEIHSHGHELAAHGLTHTRFNKFSPVDTLAAEMMEIKSLIESRIQEPVLTIHYPYSYASGNIPEAAAKAGFLFCRSGLDTINPASPPDMHLLASQAILNERVPDSAAFEQWLDQAEGNWLILMYHNLFAGDSREMSLFRAHDVDYTYSLPPEVFEKQLGRVMERDYWVAPIASIGKYIMERDRSDITIVQDKNSISIVTVSDLDTRIFNQPLTMELRLPWRKARVSGSLEDGIYKIKKDKLLIDVYPGSVITFTKAR